MAEETTKFTKEQEAARADSAYDTESAYTSGTTLGQTTSPTSPTTSPTTGATPTGGTTLIERPLERDLTLEEQNRQKMLATGEISTGMNKVLEQQKVNLFTYGVEEPIWGAADSSTKAQDQISNQMNTLGTDLPMTENQYKYYKDFKSDIKKSREEGKSLYEQTIANIEEDYRIRELEQRDENRVIMGTNSKQLARMNAFGASASAMNYLKQVDIQNQEKINKLVMEKNRVKIEAAIAFQEQDWQKLTKLMDENKKIVDQYNEVEQMMFQDSLMSAKEVREQAKFGWDLEDRQMAKISKMSSFVKSWNEISKDDRDKFLKYTGMTEENAKAYFDYNTKANKNADDFDYEKALVELRTKVPEGQSFSIGGNIYTGWKEVTPQTFQTVQTANDGTATLFSLDKNTNKLTTFKLGKVASADSTYHTDENGNVWLTTGDSTVPVLQNTTNQDGSTKQYADPKTTDGFAEWASSLNGGNISTEYESPNATAFEKVHMGVDFPIPIGTPLKPLQPGTVNNVGFDNYLGTYVDILGDDGFIYRYGHLQSSMLNVGSRVDSDTIFALSGNSGKGLQSKYATSPDGIVSPEEQAKGLGAHLDLRKFLPSQQLKSGDDKAKEDDVKKLRSTIDKEVSGYVDDFVKGSLSQKEIHSILYKKYNQQLQPLLSEGITAQDVIHTILLNYNIQ